MQAKKGAPRKPKVGEALANPEAQPTRERATSTKRVTVKSSNTQKKVLAHKKKILTHKKKVLTHKN